MLEKDQLHTNVTKQTGIYAGKERYDIQVKNTPRLKGAVIDSQAEKEKNRITTGSRMGTKWNELDEEMAAMRGRNLRDEFNKWVEDSVND